MVLFTGILRGATLPSTQLAQTKQNENEPGWHAGQPNHDWPRLTRKSCSSLRCDCASYKSSSLAQYRARRTHRPTARSADFRNRMLKPLSRQGFYARSEACHAP